MTRLTIKPYTNGVLKFKYSEPKAIEALTYIASEWPSITQFFASKVLFFAEKRHLNKYGRPIIADTFVAMPQGPVPSKVYDFIKGEYKYLKNPAAYTEAISVASAGIRGDNRKHLTSNREPNLALFSKSDLNCLDYGISFCKIRTQTELSKIAHDDPSWGRAQRNRFMDYELMIDLNNPNRDEIIEEAREFSSFGVL